MNNANETMYPDSVSMKENMRRAVRHLRFTLEMFMIQIEENHGFVPLEHPRAAKSWDTDIMQDVMKLADMKNIYLPLPSAYASRQADFCERESRVPPKRYRMGHQLSGHRPHADKGVRR